MSKKNLLAVFGGMGMEYYAGCEIFCSTIERIDTEKYNVFRLGITHDGQWLLTDASMEEISDAKTWVTKPGNKPALLTPSRGKEILMYEEDGKWIPVSIDVVFPVIAGYGGEDGRLQGLLDFAGVPYVGSGMFASACGMDKELTNIFAKKINLDLPKHTIVTKKEFIKRQNDFDLPEDMDFPVYVKPAHGGSSVAVARVQTKEEMIKAIEEALKYDDKSIIEEEINGTEIKVAVFGNDDPEFGVICEIEIPEGEVNDYETKRQHISKKNIPADLPQEVVDRIYECAGGIYKELGCSGYARVDFFLTKDKKVVFNEINTVPGIGERSIYSEMFAKKGIPYGELLLKLIDTAFE